VGGDPAALSELCDLGASCATSVCARSVSPVELSIQQRAVPSLNLGVAGAVACFGVARQRAAAWA